MKKGGKTTVKKYQEEEDDDLSQFSGDDNLGSEGSEDGDEGVQLVSSHGAETQRKAAIAAAHQIKLWEKTLSIRISLQKLIDGSNKFACCFGGSLQESEGDTIGESTQALQLSQVQLLAKLNGLLATQSNDKKVKRKFEDMSTVENPDLDLLWSQISAVQNSFQPQWEETINKWHSRLNFGAFDTTSKMKSFKQSLWEQIDATLEDRNREIEKSRMPWEDARRLYKDNKQLDEDDCASCVELANGQKYDMQIYDDRQFYSTQLKTFISNSSSQNNLLSDDLEALRQFKKKNTKVDRKASKGRRLRYNVHTKLQSYMFPIPVAEVDGNTDRLLKSLFQ